MLHTIVVCLAVAAFAGAGLVNAIARPVQRESFVRWGYPAWWCRATGTLELLIAVLIAVSTSRMVGLICGAVVIAAATATVLRHREFSHLAPISVFVTLLALAATTA